MDAGNALTLFFLQIWRLFELESPFWGLKVYQILIGLTVCELGIGIFADFFTGLLDTRAPSAYDNFKEEYTRHLWRERYKRFYS